MTATLSANALTEATVVPNIMVTVPNVPKLAVVVVSNSCAIPSAAGECMPGKDCRSQCVQSFPGCDKGDSMHTIHACRRKVVALASAGLRRSVCACTGGVVTCQITLSNAGNTRQTNITAGGDTVGCNMDSPDLLSPGANKTCLLQRTTVQDDFELGSLTLLLPLNATALGTVSVLQAPLPMSTHTVQLPQRPQLEVVTSIAPEYVWWPGAAMLF